HGVRARGRQGAGVVGADLAVVDAGVPMAAPCQRRQDRQVGLEVQIELGIAVNGSVHDLGKVFEIGQPQFVVGIGIDQVHADGRGQLKPPVGRHVRELADLQAGGKVTGNTHPLNGEVGAVGHKERGCAAEQVHAEGDLEDYRLDVAVERAFQVSLD